MALRGEGDPRWVVRDREDGRNVNSWHWEDKNVTEWARTRIITLLNASDCCSAYDDTFVHVNSVESVEGDAVLYNRKGVLRVLYDLKVVGKWTTCHEDESERTYGTFKFELFDEDPEILASIDDKSKKDTKAKQAFLKNVTPIIKQGCTTFIKELHAGADQVVDGLKKPTSKKEVVESKVTDYNRTISVAKSAPMKEGELGNLIMKDVFTCSAMDMYMALTDAKRLEAITRTKVISEVVIGGNMNLMNGQVTGRFTELEEGKCIKMEWKLAVWGKEAKSGRAEIDMNEEEGRTELCVQLFGVPTSMCSKTEGFWRIQILRAIKVVMGWGNASKFL